MDTTELFFMALGLQKPWRVAKVEFAESQSRLDIWLDFPSGSAFACPKCNKECGVYDTEERTWRHLNFFQHQTYLHARQPRAECSEHGVKTVQVPWARPGSGFTLLMDAFIMVLVQGGMTPAQVGKMIGEHDTRIWRVVRHYVDSAREKADFSNVQVLGIDETSRTRGHDYISVFMDLHPENRRVLYVCEERDSAVVGKFGVDLAKHKGAPEQIQRVCVDMSPAYIKGLAQHLPDAQITFDPFHVMKLANGAVDEVRRQEQKDEPILKGTRYLWLKNAWRHTDKQAEQWMQLKTSKLKTARAWLLKSVLQDVFTPANRQAGPELLRSWYKWAIRSRLSPMVDLARTIKRHWDGVVNWFDSQISNGVLEAINGLIQAAKRRARGYRNTQNMIAIIYLLLGKLDLALPSTAPGFAHTK
jgi:transposase